MHDCIIVGAGPAGLSAGVFLARYRRRVVLFHDFSPRNLYSHGIHGFLGHDGIRPTELLTRGRDEVRKYGGLIVERCVTDAARIADDHFRVYTRSESGAIESFDARRIVLATGLRDETPVCPGFRDFYGESVFHCPDCDGFEVTGKRVVVYGRAQSIVGFALNLLTWTENLTLVVEDGVDGIEDAHRRQLDDLSVEATSGRVAALTGDTDAKQVERVRLENGRELACDALFFNLGARPSSDLHEKLGCELHEGTDLVSVDREQQTSVAGVYAAGDITPHSQLAVVAASEGAMAAIHVHKSLVSPERRL